MLRTLSVAFVAVSLIAGPALAQSTSTAPTATSTQPTAKADAGKTDIKAKVTVGKSAKHVKHVKHVKHHVRVVKHVNHVKPVKQPAKINTTG